MERLGFSMQRLGLWNTVRSGTESYSCRELPCFWRESKDSTCEPEQSLEQHLNVFSHSPNSVRFLQIFPGAIGAASSQSKVPVHLLHLFLTASPGLLPYVSDFLKWCAYPYAHLCDILRVPHTTVFKGRTF